MEINMENKSLKQKVAHIQQFVVALTKDGKNPHFKSGHVTLNQIIEEFRPLEDKLEISITMPLCNVMGRPAIKLVIKDLKTTEVEEEIMTLPDLTDPQKMGSAITYYRRYMFMSYFNIQAVDDDGNVASGIEEIKVKKPVKQDIDDELGF